MKSEGVTKSESSAEKGTPRTGGTLKRKSSTARIVQADNTVDNGGGSMAVMDKTTRATSAAPAELFANGARIVGEAVVLPGMSLIADGDVKAGALHGLAGVVAATIFGPIGWLAVAANSYSRSVSGRHLHQHFRREAVKDAPAV